ncbi:putative non-specific serine/threonine protein kinase [Helianthus annuus]|nr:putative non-specific serine/threonine protein kinase [Helianthus annuus]KAJ0586671.1 putative non-specific serine/threonine protein kinase [Helianthus annuus]KAJ0756052.1 putative non-specific serine/threonine protein kinase [Helianthus annuus]
MPLPSLIANLTSLEYIDVSHNKFEGSFSFSSFSNHTKLEVVELTSDNDNFMVETEEPIGWTPMFQLVVLVLSNCNVNRGKGSVLPGFVVNQHKLQVLDISHNSIQGKLPNWLIKNNTMLELLNLRNNSFCHNFLMPFYRNPNIWWLDLSGNLMIGVIPKDIQKFLPYITNLNLSRNSLEGAIPCSIGDMWQLETLDLSSNQLSGEVPTGLLTNLSELSLLKLSKRLSLSAHQSRLSAHLGFTYAAY